MSVICVYAVAAAAVVVGDVAAADVVVDCLVNCSSR